MIVLAWVIFFGAIAIMVKSFKDYFYGDDDND